MKTICLLLFLSLFFTSCFQDDEVSYLDEGIKDSVLRPILGVYPDKDFKGQGLKIKVMEGSSAAKMGLQDNDVIIRALNKEDQWTAIDNLSALSEHLGQFKIGDRLTLEIERDKQTLEKQGKLFSSSNSNPLRHYRDLTSIGTYLVYLPDDYDEHKDREYPLCVILHGSGSVEGHGHIPDILGREGVIYVAPRAPYTHLGAVMHNKKPGWTAWHPDDYEENHPYNQIVVRQYVDWVFLCVDDVIENYRVSSKKVYLWGHSQGAGMANACALLQPHRLVSYYAYAGYLVDHLDSTKYLSRLEDYEIKVNLSHGRQDEVVKPDQSKKLARKMEKCGVDITLKMFDTGHYFNDRVKSDFRMWVDQFRNFD